MPLVSKNFSDIITFTRASSATYFDSAGVLQTATTNVPRFDYDPSTLAAQGLLIEEARTNLLLHNRDLTNAAWVATNITPLKNQTGIDGATNSASLITATSANGTILQSVTSVSAIRSTSAYVKRVTGTGIIEMTQDGGSTWSSVSVTSAWTRVNIPSATIANPSVGFRIVDSGDEIAVDGVQLEQSPFVTSVIMTTTTALTRETDVTSVNTLSPWYNASQGTLFVEYNIPELLTGQSPKLGTLLGAGGAFVDELALFVVQTSGKAATCNVFTGGVNAGRVDASASFAASTTTKSAFAYALNDRAVTTGGDSPVTSTTVYTIPTVTLMRIGSQDSSGTNNIYGYIRRIIYYPRRLSNAELQAITS